MSTAAMMKWQTNNLASKAQITFLVGAFLMMLVAVFQKIAGGTEFMTEGLGKIALSASYVAACLQVVAVMFGGFKVINRVAAKLTVWILIAVGICAAAVLNQQESTYALYLFASVGAAVLVAIVCLLPETEKTKMRSHNASKSLGQVQTQYVLAGVEYPKKKFTKGGANDPFITEDGKWKARGLVRRASLVGITTDAGVGLHTKYEQLDVPAVDWSNMIGNKDLQIKIRTAVHAIQSPWFQRYPDDPYPNNAPNGILLTGDPGNGKTFVAELIAGYKQLPLFTLTKDVVASQWVGETSKALNASFELVKRNAPCVLFIDEIDSFVMARGNASSGNAADAESRSVVNIFLTALVELRKYPVIIVAASNHLESLDPAVVREGRFDFKITVDNPDKEARIGLLSQSLKKHVPQAIFNWPEIEKAATRFNGFNVKRMLSIGERTKDVLNKSGTLRVGHEEIMAALRMIQGTKGRIPEDALSLEEIVLRPKTRQHVENLLLDLKSINELEEFGGQIVKGILFYGPAGTGKTTVAKTIAKESGWGFLSVSGPDLVADRKLLEDTYTRAKELRPCIIFIDEADEIMKDRTINQYAERTNKLLTIMQGVDDPVKDVVFIAATNHPEQIDPALLRTGRFTGKVVFEQPGSAELHRLSEIWLSKRKDKVTFDANVDLHEFVNNGGFSQANLEGVLQGALNNAIRSGSIDEGKAVVRQEHLELAMNFIDA